MELSGTSFAAPVVAAAAAQVLARHPEWTPDQVKGALMVSAKDTPSAVRGSLGVGMVDATQRCRGRSPPNPNAALEAVRRRRRRRHGPDVRRGELGERRPERRLLGVRVLGVGLLGERLLGLGLVGERLLGLGLLGERLLGVRFLGLGLVGERFLGLGVLGLGLLADNADGDVSQTTAPSKRAAGSGESSFVRGSLARYIHRAAGGGAAPRRSRSGAPRRPRPQWLPRPRPGRCAPPQRSTSCRRRTPAPAR